MMLIYAALLTIPEEIDRGGANRRRQRLALFWETSCR